MDAGVTNNAAPRAGHMAFVRSLPTNVSVELLQKARCAGAEGALGVDGEITGHWSGGPRGLHPGSNICRTGGEVLRRPQFPVPRSQ